MCLRAINLIPDHKFITKFINNNKLNHATALVDPDQLVNPDKMDNPAKMDNLDNPVKMDKMDNPAMVANNSNLAPLNAQWAHLVHQDPPDQLVNPASPVSLDRPPMDSPVAPDLRVLPAHLDRLELLDNPDNPVVKDKSPLNPDPKDPPAQLVPLASPETMVPQVNPDKALKVPPARPEMLEHLALQETQDHLEALVKMVHPVDRVVAIIAHRHEHRLATKLDRQDVVWRSREKCHLFRKYSHPISKNQSVDPIFFTIFIISNLWLYRQILGISS